MVISWCKSQNFKIINKIFAMVHVATQVAIMYQLATGSTDMVAVLVNNNLYKFTRKLNFVNCKEHGSVEIIEYSYS